MRIDSIKTSPDAQVRVCRNKDTGNFVIVHQCRFKWEYSAVEVGKVDRISAQEFEKRGLKTVVDSLTAFSSRKKTEPSELELLTEPEQSKFNKDHEHALVTVGGSGELLCQPYEAGDNGAFISSETSAVRVPFPIEAERFYAAIVEALENAA